VISIMSKSVVTENFAEMLEQSLHGIKNFEGKVMKGTIVALEADVAVVDVGLKSEGRVALREFGFGSEQDLKVGDVVDLYLERMENRDGEIVLSREKARREAAWEELEVSFSKKERVMGVITGRVKGGFIVDISGASAFLPGSQIDVRPIKDVYSLMGISQPFVILKMDRPRGNIVVSRRAILEESRAEARSEIIATIQEGNIMEGTVKNLTEYGAFVDLGGIDGLLHVTDISWNRVGHPSDVLHVGQVLNVKILKINENNRISLGLKQLEENPWMGLEDRIIPGTEVEGTVKSFTEYGFFVELEPGIEGLVHGSELSWTKKNVPPSKFATAGDKVRVKVLEVDIEKHRIGLSLKQCTPNPWKDFADKYPIGTIVEGEFKNSFEHGIFIGLSDGIDGMVHIADISWERSGPETLAKFKKGDMVRAKVLDVDSERERVNLGIKQLEEDPFGSLEGIKSGDILTCTVKSVNDRGVEVTTDKGIPGFLRKGDLAKDRSEQRSERFAVGERVDAQVISVDPKARKLSLSIKAREIAEEKKVMAEYGSSDSGARLGDILGAAIDMEKIKEKTAAKKAPKASKEKKAEKDAE
jgi:small subunit ribosomal protein S1